VTCLSLGGILDLESVSSRILPNDITAKIEGQEDLRGFRRQEEKKKKKEKTDFFPAQAPLQKGRVEAS
jgi:hypothetical protein